MGYAVLSGAGLVGFAAADVAAAAQSELASPLVASKAKASPADGRPVVDKTSPAIAAGDALFKANCTQCHAVNEQVVGPALAGITKRRSIGWIIPWVKNSAKVVASGDEYAVALYNRFQKQQMPSFRLSDKEIEEIVAYVSSEMGGAVTIDDSSLTAAY
ncbi:cytochrome c [Hymenobacter nivis]|uniref:Cytochrome c n=2 Tax=Hymenobacter nivis TaxID=1850093 RepID=A0A502GWK7_9BACT|nr:cytochrome c [Hymenobacter nivis]